MNTKAKDIVMVQKTQGLVGNTHHDEKHMLTNYALDRMSGPKAAKRSNSGATPLSKTIELGAPTLAPQMPHYGS